MRFRLSAWRPLHLLLAWVAYWVALAIVAIGPAVPVLARVTRPDAHGSVSASYGDAGLQLLISDGATSWTRSFSLWAILIAVGVPPLILWILWQRSQRKQRAGALGNAPKT